MAQSANTPTSPANYDFLMRRASTVYEAQFEVFVECMHLNVVLRVTLTTIGLCAGMCVMPRDRLRHFEAGIML